MASIAVVHPNLGMKGGAENVCLHTLQALQSKHDLTLVTLNEPDFETLNAYFGTSVDRPNVRVVGRIGPEVNDIAGNRLMKLQAALLGRSVSKISDEYDLLLSTKNEFPFQSDSVQYIHTPQFYTGDPEFQVESFLQEVYGRVCRLVVGMDRDMVRTNTLLANSDWTGEIVEKIYGVQPKTVYPPVQVEEIHGEPWSEREEGFVTIGRIEPNKHVLRTIDIISMLRSNGHDVHLHIVGPTTHNDYCERVQERAEECEYISFEGAVSREELLELIATHRYGIHGRPYEHFGIVVAEMVAGGMIPFVPDSGGQREIVDERQELLYTSKVDAVRSIQQILSTPSMIHSIREHLENSSDKYDVTNFHSRVRSVTQQALFER